jgi:hypothetical protein
MLNASTFERNVDSDQELKLSFDRGLSAAIMTACNNVWGLLHGNRAVAANALLAKRYTLQRRMEASNPFVSARSLC